MIKIDFVLTEILHEGDFFIFGFPESHQDINLYHATNIDLFSNQLVIEYKMIPNYTLQSMLTSKVNKEFFYFFNGTSTIRLSRILLSNNIYKIIIND